MSLIIDQWTIGAGALVISALTLSLYEIIKHLQNFTKPYLQRYIIRILFMVPIYSLNAWSAMLIPGTGLYFDSMREVYESFVIYSFMKYLLNFLRYDTNLQQYIDHKPGPGQIFPLCCFPNCIGGRSFLIRCKHGVLQYVVVRPITSLIGFVSQLLNFYGEGNYNPLSGYTYPVLLIINNISQILAMYCLVIFYTGYRQELAPMRPLAKFFSIKLIVFFSFFQSVAISGLIEIHYIEGQLRMLFPELNDKISIVRKAQELLICFDMLIAAIGHLFAFSYKPYTEYSDHDHDHDDSRRQHDERRRLESSWSSGAAAAADDRSCCSALGNLFDFSDERSDMSEHFGAIAAKIKQLFTCRRALPAVVSQDTQHLDDGWMERTRDERLAATTTTTASGRPPGSSSSMGSATRNYKTIIT